MARTKTEQKKRAILDAAAKVFAEHGYHATTVQQIAQELNMGLGTFYRYFENKLAVFHAVIEEVMAQVTVVLATEQPTQSTTLEEYRAQVERIGRALFAAFQENRSLARLLFVEAPGISAELNAQLQAAVTFFGVATQAYLDNGVKRGFLRQDLDTEITALAVNAIIFEGVRHVASAEGDRPAERGLSELGAAADDSPRSTDQQHSRANQVLERWLAATRALMFEGVRAR